MAMTTADMNGVLKERYPNKKVLYIGYKDNPFLALVPKDTSFVGKVYDCPLWYGGNQGGSHTFSKAQANKSGGLYGQFLLTRNSDYALTSIPTEAILASAEDVGSFLKATTSEVDNCIRMSSQNLNRELFGNTGGARGRVGSVSTVTLTLKNINDVVNFEKDMLITSSNTDGTSGSDDGEAIKITKVDYMLGKLTAAVTWTAGGNFSNDDYLFREGDFGKGLAGLDAYLPSAAPSATAFFGQDRSVSSRLGGLRYDGSSESIEEALQSADSIASREGAKLSHFIINHVDLASLKKSLGSKVIYDRVQSVDMPSIGFRSVVLDGMNGEIQIVADRKCPSGVTYGLQMDTWVFASLGPAPRFLAAAGQDGVILDYNADSVEFRTGYYGQLGCYAPGHNIRVALPTG